MKPCIYDPVTDKWYLLPATECQGLNMEQIGHATVFCRGRMFFIADDIARSQCYDPDSNRWCSAPWEKKLPFSKGASLVVGNRICFLVEETDSTALWTFSVNSNSFTPLRNWVEIANFCAVAVDIFVIGGSARKVRGGLAECARFDTEQNEWKKNSSFERGEEKRFWCV